MRIGLRAVIWLSGLLLPVGMWAQSVPTTTVQGTVYLAGGAPGSGTVLVSWPAFTTAANQQVAAGKTVVTVGTDGFLSVNLAANLGANPAGLYYTAVFHLSDGTVDTQYRRQYAAELFGVLGGDFCESAVECDGVKCERQVREGFCRGGYADDE